MTLATDKFKNISNKWPVLFVVVVVLVNLFLFEKEVSLLSRTSCSVGLLFSVYLSYSKLPRIWAQLVTAITLGIIVYTISPNILVDDTGFIIRYMNQAANGCFYCFNESEGPVFGISGFLYGVLTCTLALPGFFSPESIIKVVGLLSLVWLFFMLIRIFLKVIEDATFSILALVAVLVFSYNMIIASTYGLETNFHLAIVFTGVYFFLMDQPRAMWLFLAFSVISKLDAVPLVLVLALIYLAEHRKDFFRTTGLSHWGKALLYFGLPILGFVVISYIMFDGPIPQSAHAKINFHKSTLDGWFPFIEPLIKTKKRVFLVVIALVFALVHLLVGLRRKNVKASDFSLGLGFFGTLVLYYFYNPAERMIWYYALPELLLFSQGLFSLVFLARLHATKSTHIYIAGVGALIILALPVLKKDIVWMDKTLRSTENERLVLAEKISQLVAPGDTLMAGHGHYAAATKGFVIDQSGLNSKLVTEYKRNADSLLTDFKPTWFIQHADNYFLKLANDHQYRLVDGGFNVNKRNAPIWLLVKRSPTKTPFGLKRAFHPAFSQSAKDFAFSDSLWAPVTRVIFGLEYFGTEPMEISLKINGMPYTVNLNPYEPRSELSVQTVLLEVRNPKRKLVFEIDQEELMIYDPIIEYDASLIW